MNIAKKGRLWATTLAWILIAIGCLLWLPHLGNPFKIGDITDPAAESAEAQKTIETKLPFGGSSIFVLYKSNKFTVHNTTFVSQVKKSLSGLDRLPFKTQVTSPYENSRQISADNHEAYAVIKTDSTAEELANSMKEIRAALGHPEDLEMIIGGKSVYIADVYKLSESNLVRAEIIALPICFIVMIFVFGGIIPALVTILSGVISITIIITILYWLGHQMTLTVFVLNIASMLGLGLSLDYSLLITYRFREEFAKSHNYAKAINVTLATSGISILFSGIIFLISIASLIFFPINILFSIGIAGIVVILVTVLCSLTFLPAMLCLLQKRVTGVIPQLKKISTENVHDHKWYRFSMLVMKYPFLFFIPTIIILLLLGYPFLNVTLNNSDAKILPTWVESRQLIDQFHENFNANDLDPIIIVFKAKNNSILTKENIAQLYDYAKRLEKDPRVDRVSSLVTIKPKLNKKEYQQMYSSSSLPFDEYQKQFFNESTKGRYTIMSITTKYPRENKRNFALIKKIREDHIGNGIEKQVTGSSAEILDYRDMIYILFVKVVIIISIVTYLTLMWLLRSLILPLKAILMNFLSLSVCYGMLVFIFQEGHFSRFLNFKPLGFTDMNLPILLFFALFGLSMDYEVFLLTRIKEYYEKTRDNNQSVALGLERSARIITSAALIMVIVSAAFVTADIVFIKAFGLGMALAIAVDASLIRLLLVPATMRLLGDWNWYIPKWLDRILPNINFDQEKVE